MGKAPPRKYVLSGVCFLFVCLSVCLNVRLLAHSRRLNTESSRKFCQWTRTRIKNWLNFWSHPLLEPHLGTFWRIINIAIWGIFPAIWLPSLEKLIGPLSKYYHRCIFRQESPPLNCGDHTHPDSGSGTNRLGGGLCSSSALVFVCLKKVISWSFYLVLGTSAIDRLERLISEMTLRLSLTHSPY